MFTIKQSTLFTAMLAIGTILPANAASDHPLIFTILGPSVQETAVTDGVTTQDFDSVPNWDKVFRAAYPSYTSFVWEGVGTYEGSGAKVDNNNKYGAAGGVEKYLFIYNTEIQDVGQSIEENPGVTLTFDVPQAYFGFWWSAGDYANRLQVTLSDGTVVDIVTDQVMTSEGFVDKKASEGGHKGNPTSKYLDQNSHEGYAYLNLYATDENRKIQKIRFHGRNFETDNHSVTETMVPNPPGTPIPLPPLPPQGPEDFGEFGRFNVREAR